MKVLKNPMVLFILVVISIACWYAFYEIQIRSDIEAKGSEEIIAWVSLFTAIVSLITSLIGMVMKVIEIMQAGKGD